MVEVSGSSAPPTEPTQTFDSARSATVAPVANAARRRRGAVIKQVYAERSVTVYAVHEAELNQLALVNTAMQAFLAMGSAAFSFGIGIRVNEAFAETLSPTAQVLSGPGFWASMIIGAAFVLLSLVAYLIKSNTLETIKRESKQVNEA